ncbi:MAG: polysulfide reductase NrfD [Ardenticatenales bacterium]|nr:polysulfide reductase NrfD [Ardenticatenales bacterium]
MNFGFLIDNRKCIGCHACSTACKQENQVPLGVNRTWVKYVEKGAFPDTRRFFQVTRCNHCANPPCVRICPVTAMYQRTDGIVEFDGDVCIGCKACLQACPYDAIYMDPDTGTAAKCHFCSHRTDLGLEPACGVVCPTQAIVSGDLDDPSSTIRQLLGRHDVSVRKPEQGTLPKVFYIDADAVTLVPTMSSAAGAYMWADRDPTAVQGQSASSTSLSAHGASGAPDHTLSHDRGDPSSRRHSASGTPLRSPVPQGAPATGPISLGGTMAGHMVQTGYNAQHRAPWHWPVPAYLVTKAIGSGAFMLLAALSLTGRADDPVWATIASAVAALFTAITAGLLVADLDRPERFLRILTRPQWRSWLTRGAFILMGFGARRDGEHGAGRRDVGRPHRRRRPRPAARDAPRRRCGARRSQRSLHRVPVRPSRGPRSLAEPVAAGAPDRPSHRRRCRRPPRRRRLRRAARRPVRRGRSARVRHRVLGDGDRPRRRRAAHLRRRVRHAARHAGGRDRGARDHARALSAALLVGRDRPRTRRAARTRRRAHGDVVAAGGGATRGHRCCGRGGDRRAVLLRVRVRHGAAGGAERVARCCGHR